MRRLVVALLVLSNGLMLSADDPLILDAVVTTEPLFNYEDAPATPDADDPAIWINRQYPLRSLVIGTAKDAGLVVYDLSGNLIQAMLPPNAPHVSDQDPATPAGPNPSPDNPCPESESGETFGRYNNVDIAYDVALSKGRRAPRADVVVVSDRGCDRVRFFRIDPENPVGPLVDITSAAVQRVFPQRYNQPSPTQSPAGAEQGWTPNPLDDQNTVYGLTVAPGLDNAIFVTERERGLVRQLSIELEQDGTLSYSPRRTFVFDTNFNLRNGLGQHYDWTPCREAVVEEPQSEGVVFDSGNDILYVAFETLGLYRIPLGPSTPKIVHVGLNRLIEPVKTFGQPYWAIPDDDEFECEYDPAGTPDPGVIEAVGSDANVGEFLEADLEGLSVVTSEPGQTLLLASSQGDSSFHFYRIGSSLISHLGSFFVEGVGDTDGVHYAPVPLGPQYPLGLLVIQNGDAPGPANEDPVNGYEFDGATQFKYIDFAEALKALIP